MRYQSFKNRDKNVTNFKVNYYCIDKTTLVNIFKHILIEQRLVNGWRKAGGVRKLDRAWL